MVLLLADWTTCTGALHLTDTVRGWGWRGGGKKKKGVKERERPLILLTYSHQVSPMSRRSPPDLMRSLNPIGLRGIVVRSCHAPPPHPPLPSTLGRFVLPASHPPPPALLFSSSSTPPKQNFFKCLISPPFGFLFASALSLVCPSIFHPSPAAAAPPPSASFPSLLLLHPLSLSPLPPACIAPVLCC